jgi:tRNA-specific adenosine deaminase 3
VIKDQVPGQDLVDLQHLRRFAKPKYLPTHVLGQRDLVKEMYSIPRAWESTPMSVMQAPQTSVWEYATPSRPRGSGKSQTLHLLICPTKVISLRDLYEILMAHTPFCSSADSWAYPLEIKEITVPLLPPTSLAQAEELSVEYWPTFYRKTNPFGAHPASITKAEEELHSPQEGNLGVDAAMELAEKIGAEGVGRGIGAGPGCVIVERVEGKTNIIAVASDARYRPQEHQFADNSTRNCGRGNMMGHAVMRAVGMVGRKRLRVASTGIANTAAKAESNFTKGGLVLDQSARDAFFLDLPVMESEQEYFEVDNLKPDGYLSLKLEVFLTHEPCMMCCMALVHSRVGRVIFKHRMPQTGGLTAEMVSNNSGPTGLGYGLCWRKELNWQFMCWEYMRASEEGTDTRQDNRKDSEKYPAEDADTVDITSANVTVSSFASMFV